jgi:uncharacterized protein (TIGR02246 family)
MIKACVLVMLSLFSGAFALEQTDRSAIQKVIQDYTDSWNLHGGKGFADGFTEDADFVNIFGGKFSGKAEIENRHIKIIQTIFKDSKFEILSTQLREVQPGVVTALVDWQLKGFRTPGSDMSLPGETRKGVFTQVFIRSGDAWKIAASQNTLMPK